MGEEDSGGPRVLDTTTGIAGAYAALLLHQAGGEVVWAPPAATDDPELPSASPLFAYLRQGQRAVRVDRSELDATWATSGADVVLATPGPGEREGFPARCAAHPDLIAVALTPHGLEGPYRDRPASDLTLQADSGALAIRGNAGEAPVQMGGRTIQWLAGAYGAVAALALWRGRGAGGPGGLVDVALAEVANTGGANFMDVFHAVDRGADAEPVAPARAFETPSIERTADGWVGFNTNAPHQAAAFLRMLGRDDLADRGEFLMAGERLGRIDEWQAMVTAWTSTRTTADVIEAAVAHQVPVAPVCNGRMVTELDHVAARGALVDEPGGRFRMPGRPWRIDGERGPAPAPAPTGHETAIRWRARPDSEQQPPGREGERPLAGLRILDLTTWWAGPAATALLAALGADVIHVEGPSRMDGARLVGASFADRPEWWERSPFFLAANLGKRGVVLDLASDRGRSLALDLVAEVDAVVENFTPRVLDKLGLGWQAIHAANPRAVLVRMPAFGLDGPWRERPGFAQNIEQAAGLAWITGRADDQPRIQRGPCDPNGGVHAAIGLLVALDRRDRRERRDRTGRGSLVEASLFDAALALAAEPIVEWGAHGVVMGRDGNRSAQAAPQGVYRCAGPGDDPWLALTVANDEQWPVLADLVGRSDLAVDPGLADLAGRRARHDELDAVLSAWAADQDLDDAVARLVGAGIPAAPARDPRLTARHPQFAARGYHRLVDHPVTGPLPLPTLPFRVHGPAGAEDLAGPAPRFGQHTDEVLSDLLGLGADELAGLRADGTTADRPVGM